MPQSARVKTISPSQRFPRRMNEDNFRRFTWTNSMIMAAARNNSPQPKKPAIFAAASSMFSHCQKSTTTIMTSRIKLRTTGSIKKRNSPPDPCLRRGLPPISLFILAFRFGMPTPLSLKALQAIP